MEKGAKAAKLADQIRDYLAAWIREDFPGCLVSVAHVQLSTNLQQATIWIEGFTANTGAVVRDLQKEQRRYQQRLYRALDKRAIPAIRFMESKGADDQDRIDRLLNGERF